MSPNNCPFLGLITSLASNIFPEVSAILVDQGNSALVLDPSFKIQLPTYYCILEFFSPHI